MVIAEILQSLEEKLLDPTVRRSPGALDELLADEFLEFGSSGRIFNRAAIIAELQTESYNPPIISDFEARLLAPGLALVTYRTTRHAGGPQPASSALRSSLWVERDNRWQVLFHQGTKTSVLNDRH
jgi:hypothetical protein